MKKRVTPAKNSELRAALGSANAEIDQRLEGTAQVSFWHQTDIALDSTNVRCWQIVLQTVFLGDERNFLEVLMRFTSGDVRDHFVSSQVDQ